MGCCRAVAPQRTEAAHGQALPGHTDPAGAAGTSAADLSGQADARKLAHARILLQAYEAEGGPRCTDGQIASALDASTRTVERVRERFVERGLDAALLPKPSKRAYARKLDGHQEARLIALACSKPPAGKARWTLRMLTCWRCTTGRTTRSALWVPRQDVQAADRRGPPAAADGAAAPRQGNQPRPETVTGVGIMVCGGGGTLAAGNKDSLLPRQFPL